MRTRWRSTAPPEEYRSSQLVELRFVPDWARTIARRVLYEAADELRLESLKASGDPAVAGLAAKIDREEAYHRMHAELWHDRLRDEPRYRAASRGAAPVRAGPRRDRSSGQRLPRGSAWPKSKQSSAATHADGWPELWDEMTEVRRSIPGAAW